MRTYVFKLSYFKSFFDDSPTMVNELLEAEEVKTAIKKVYAKYRTLSFGPIVIESIYSEEIKHE